MIKGCKICGVSDPVTLSFILDHPYAPKFIGFICNYQKSPRYVEFNKLEKLLNINKNNSQYVAVLVKPNEEILEKIKNLPFDYYQLYDCTPEQINFIKIQYWIALYNCRCEFHIMFFQFYTILRSNNIIKVIYHEISSQKGQNYKISN